MLSSFHQLSKLMRHTDWLRLKTQGERICSVLRLEGYQCRKQTRRLSWKVRKEGSDSYVLIWLPAPVGEWSLIPSIVNPEREKLMSLVQTALKTDEGKVMTYQQIQQPEDYSRPWTIVRLLPNARRYTVAKFFNRIDAEDHLRVLHRFMPVAEFEIIFNSPDESDEMTNSDA